MFTLALTVALAAQTQAQKPATPQTPLEIAVVDELGAPVAGARVVALAASIASKEYARLGSECDDRDILAVLDKLGASATSDAQGLAHLERSSPDMLLTASAPNRFAYGDIDAKSGAKKQLVLTTDSSIRIQVLDANGAPASGVPVALFRFIEGPDASINAPGACAWSRPTKADGTLTLEHAQTYLGPGGDAKTRFELGLGIPLRDAARVAIDPKSLPKEPIVLRMPPTGSVTIKMAEAPESWARIRVLPSKGTSVFERGADTFWSNYTPAHAKFEHGVARFANVALGLQVQVEAFWKDAVAPARFVHAGPTTAGENVAIEIDAQHGPGGIQVGAQDAVILEGQEIVKPKVAFLSSTSIENDRFEFCFVPPSGDPMDANRQFALRVGSWTPPSSGWHLAEADHTGHFRFELDTEHAKIVSRSFHAPIARRIARPFALSARFEAQSPSYSPGEKVLVRMHAANVSKLALSIDRPWNTVDGRDRYEFVGFKEGAQLLELKPTGAFGGGDRAQQLTELEPGASFEELVNVSKWFAFDSPGTYDVDASYELHIEGTPIPFEGGEGCPVLLTKCTDHLRGHFQVIVR